MVPCSLQVRDAAGFWLGGLAQAGARGCVVTQPGVIAYASDWQTHTKKTKKNQRISPRVCHGAMLQVRGVPSWRLPYGAIGRRDPVSGEGPSLKLKSRPKPRAQASILLPCVS